MQIENSKYNLLVKKKIETDVGVFYIFEEFIVGEFNEDVQVTWKIIEDLMEQVFDFFGTRDKKLCYVSNRVYYYEIKH